MLKVVKKEAGSLPQSKLVEFHSAEISLSENG